MEIHWRRISITTPTPCLRYMPRLTSCRQLRFNSEMRMIFLFEHQAAWIWCFFFLYYFLHKLCRISGKRLWVFHPPSPTPIQELKVHPSIHVGSERPVLLLWLMCTCSITLQTHRLPVSIQHIIHSPLSESSVNVH